MDGARPTPDFPRTAAVDLGDRVRFGIVGVRARIGSDWVLRAACVRGGSGRGVCGCRCTCDLTRSTETVRKIEFSTKQGSFT